MAVLSSMWRYLAIVVVVFIVDIAGQNQVPPGIRRPPFIVVPPETERSHVSNSNRRDVSATGPEVILRPDEQIMIPEQRPQSPPNHPQSPPNHPQSPPNHPQPAPQQPQSFPKPRQPPQNQPQIPQQSQNFPKPPQQPQNQPPIPQQPPNFPNPPQHPSNQPSIPHQQPEPHLPILRPQFPNENQPSGRPAINRPNLPPLDQRCFHCICMAASGCDPELKCVQPSPNQYFCGQYHISWAYWADSGKPGDRPDFPGAWEDCLIDTVCAERSIQSYMNKFAGDCNNDGNLDCVDFARIHKAGPPPSCNATWVDETAYWQRFVSCWGGGLDLRRSKGRK